MADAQRVGVESSPLALWTFVPLGIVIAGASFAASLFPFDEAVPFGCGRNPAIVDGLIARSVCQIVLVVALLSGLWLRFSAKASRILGLVLFLGEVALSLLVFSYYAWWAALEVERAGPPACGDAWADPTIRGLVWALPSVGVALDAGLTLLLRRRWRRAGSIAFSLLALSATGLQIAAAV